MGRIRRIVRSYQGEGVLGCAFCQGCPETTCNYPVRLVKYTLLINQLHNVSVFTPKTSFFSRGNSLCPDVLRSNKAYCKALTPCQRRQLHFRQVESAVVRYVGQPGAEPVSGKSLNLRKSQWGKLPLMSCFSCSFS